MQHEEPLSTVQPHLPSDTHPSLSLHQRIDVENPATGRVLYALNGASAGHCAAAMLNARKSAEVMRSAPLRERLAALDAVLRYLEENQDLLLDRIVAETGRSRGDVMLSDIFQLTEDCRWLRSHSAEVLADEVVKTPISLVGKSCRIVYQPRGVVLVISPWNLPLAIGMTASMFAFVAGNAVVLKPSEHTPMADTFEEIRSLHPLLHSGLQVVHGNGEVAERLIAHQPDAICFTGSVATGKKVLSQAAPLVIPVTLELGAKDAMIVLPDADMSRAVAAACWGNLHNSGQSCTATERVLVQAAVHDNFVLRLVRASERIRLGTGPDADLGAITTAFQMRHIEALVEDARSRGAQIRCGGRRSDCGRYYLPTVITDVTSEMRIQHEETFGPVLTVMKFEDVAEAIEAHNAVHLGLSTSVWTSDRALADRLVRDLQTGCVNVNNVMLTEGNASLPFGGVKGSGFGRMKGVEGLRGMVQSKAVLDDATRGKPEAHWYPYSSDKLALTQRVLSALGRRGLTRYAALLEVGLRVERLLKRMPKT